MAATALSQAVSTPAGSSSRPSSLRSGFTGDALRVRVATSPGALVWKPLAVKASVIFKV